MSAGAVVSKSPALIIVQRSGLKTVYCAYLEQKHANSFAFPGGNKFEKLFEERKMVGTRDVTSRRINTAKTKITGMKTLSNQQTAPFEVGNTTLECKENRDEVEIQSPEKLEVEAEIPP